MRFNLRVDLDNAAFADGNFGTELARILRKVATQVEGDTVIRTWHYTNVRDINGNPVGAHAVKDDDGNSPDGVR